MGLYDTIIFTCPACGKKIQVQSKSGLCLMRSYPATAVPLDIAAAANRHPTVCQCGKAWFAVVTEVSMKLVPVDARARPVVVFVKEAAHD